MGDRQGRFSRIDVQRREVHFKMRVDLGYVETADRFHFHTQAGFKRYVDPIREGFDIQWDLLAGDLNEDAPLLFIKIKSEGQAHLLALFEEGVFRSGDVGGYPAAVPGYGNDDSAFIDLGVCVFRSIIGKGALAALEIRCAHS